jgi:uncharacterized protein YjbI with pentapeptide repeats
MRMTCALIAIALAIGPTCALAGTDYQGMSMQGMNMQGVNMQGISLQGTSTQGTSAQGTTQQGTGTKARSITIGSANLINIELPR